MEYISEKDRKYIPKTPDRNFNPARSRAIIEEVIQHNEREAARREKEWADMAAGKADAAACYLNKRANGSFISIEDYFGPALKNEIWGKRFAEKLKMAQMLYKKDKRKTRFLL